VGEFLLLSRLLPPHVFAGVTLPPTTPIEHQSYRRWQRRAAELAPRAVFDAGTFPDVSFHDNLAASDFILSTSVAEGFGMAFLEPWLAGRGVVARRLPTVTADFRRAGLPLQRFYDAVWIPGTDEWVNRCRRETEAAFRAAWASLPQQLGPRFQVRKPEAEPQRGVIDFATLTPERQLQVLGRARADGGYQHAIERHNRVLMEWLSQPFDVDELASHRKLIETRYSLPSAAERLRQIYAAVMDSAAAVPVPTAAARPASDRAAGASGTAPAAVDRLCRQRAFFPCRTETEITP
jgi:hypothetical protein